MILKCNKCVDYRSQSADYQNEKYGEGMRVHNRCTKDGNSAGHRCTVCGSVRKG